MIELRRIVRDDIGEMVEIQEMITKKPVGESWKGMVESHLANRNGAGYVATRGGRVVGFVIGEVKGEGFGLPHTGWIEVVGVDPRVMGEGIGKALLDRLCDHFRELGIVSIYTAVRWDSVDMISFFKSVGFGRSDFINLVHKL